MKKVTWNELAKIYNEKTGKVAQTQSMQAIFEWAEMQTDLFYVNENDELCLVERSSMNTKILEIRDIGTFIPVICIEMRSDSPEEKYLLWRTGFGPRRLIQLVYLTAFKTEYDPMKWCDRTLYTAHDYITEHWDELKTGDVVDVQYILGETANPKQSERKEPYDI